MHNNSSSASLSKAWVRTQSGIALATQRHFRAQLLPKRQSIAELLDGVAALRVLELARLSDYHLGCTTVPICVELAHNSKP